MRTNPKVLLVVVGFLIIVLSSSGSNSAARRFPKGTPTNTGMLTVKPSRTPTSTFTAVPTSTHTPTATDAVTPTDTVSPTDTLTPTDTLEPTVTNTPTDTEIPTVTPTPAQVGTITPYPSAPLCPDSGENHPNTEFHTLWDSVRGCHYDHEHGQNPFTAEVEATFPGFDLLSLLGNVQIGHTNPSSSMENTMKHGGFKWDVTLSHTAGCGTGPVEQNNLTGVGVNAFVSQYHNFGNYSIEFESRVHSALMLMRQCLVENPTDYGYVYVVQWQDYGQRTVPYQGTIYPYPNNPVPEYPSPLSPYFTVDCIGNVIQCRSSRQFVLDHNANTASIWTSAPQAAPISSPLFGILFRIRDTYQLIDWNDQVYPFSFFWVCSSDNGLTYNGHMTNCRWNNSASRIHEIHGTIPEAWDNLEGFDTDNRIGRITADGYVTAFGDLNMMCTEPGIDCFPIKLVSAFVGRYRSTFGLVSGKGQLTPENIPERDIYFCNGVVCSETTPGAVPSGWIGPNN